MTQQRRPARHTHSHVRFGNRLLPRNLTAGTVVRGAQIGLLAIGGWAMLGYFSGSITDEQATRALRWRLVHHGADCGTRVIAGRICWARWRCG